MPFFTLLRLSANGKRPTAAFTHSLVESHFVKAAAVASSMKIRRPAVGRRYWTGYFGGWDFPSSTSLRIRALTAP